MDVDVVTRADLIALTENSSRPCVSLFVPTSKKYGENARQGRIWLKNLLSEAEESLKEYGSPPRERQRMLSPLSRLVEDRPFWEKQSDGLAIFSSPGETRQYRVPLRLEGRVLVGPRFHVKPLLPLLPGNSRFYVLALSQNDVKLHECTRHRMSEVDLGDTPRSLAEALKYDDPEKQLQYHTGTAQTRKGGGRRPAMYHGQGSSKDAAKDALQRYLREVEGGVSSVLREEDVPLVLAGVDYLLSIYRDVSTYPHVLERQVAGNTEKKNHDDLLEAAWNIVEPTIRARLESATRNFGAAAHRSTDLPEIVRAAHQGRVELLLLDVKQDARGSFDEDSGEARLDGKPPERGEELLNLAAVLTLSRGGTVHAIEAGDMPDGEAAAAVFRY